MTSTLPPTIALATCIFGAVAHAACPTPTRAPDDPTTLWIREENFLRGVSDLGIGHVLEDLESVDPAAQSTDPATGALREVARLRLLLKESGTERGARLKAFEDLRRVRQALADAHQGDGRTAIWWTNAAEDEFVLGFLGLDGGSESIAGSPLREVATRAAASLDRVDQNLARAATAAASAPAIEVPDGSSLAQALDDDARGRRPMLAAASRAMRLVVDRTVLAEKAQQSQRAEALNLVKVLDALRGRIGVPTRLYPELDLASLAAAAVAVDPNTAQLSAERTNAARDQVLTTLSQILVAEGLLRGGRGDEAQRHLLAHITNDSLSAALRVLTADALVRVRNTLGEHPASTESLQGWIDALRRAPSSQRAGVRRAVLERIANALRDVPVDRELPALAAVALARDHLATGNAPDEAIKVLRAHARSESDSEARATAIVVLAEAHCATGDWASASDDYRMFAECSPTEPMALAAIQTALDIECALDRAHPDARQTQFEQTLRLALQRFAELPSRPNSIAQLEAIKTRRVIDEFNLGLGNRSANLSATLSDAVLRLAQTVTTAERAGIALGPRIDATLIAAKIALDCLANSGATAPTDQEVLPSARWATWTNEDATRVLQARLERVMRTGAMDRAAFDQVFAELPAPFRTDHRQVVVDSLIGFLRNQLDEGRARLARDGASALEARELARGALLAVEAWEGLSPPIATTSSPTIGDSANEIALARLAADAAHEAQAWESAVSRSESIATRTWATVDDQRRLAESLASAAISAETAKDFPLRDDLRGRAMTCARNLSASSPPQSKEWWSAQVIQVQIAQDSGRGGDGVQAKIARLRALDGDLGGDPSRSALEGLSARAAQAPSHQ